MHSCLLHYRLHCAILWSVGWLFSSPPPRRRRRVANGHPSGQPALLDALSVRASVHNSARVCSMPCVADMPADRLRTAFGRSQPARRLYSQRFSPQECLSPTESDPPLYPSLGFLCVLQDLAIRQTLQIVGLDNTL